jgi:hypothetical protein
MKPQQLCPIALACLIVVQCWIRHHQKSERRIASGVSSKTFGQRTKARGKRRIGELAILTRELSDGTSKMWGIGTGLDSNNLLLFFNSNNWAVPTEMVSVEDSNMRGGGRVLKQKIWDAARDVIQGKLEEVHSLDCQ